MSKLYNRVATLLVCLFVTAFSVRLVMAQEDDTRPQLSPPPTPAIDWSAVELPPHDLPAAADNHAPQPDAPEPTHAPAIIIHEEPTPDSGRTTPPTPPPDLPTEPALHPTDPNQYTVRRGDTLFLIAQAYGINTAALAAYNDLTNPHLIYPGQPLHIPATNATGILYTVQAGETLEQIGRRFNLSVQELAAANALTHEHITPGTMLTIPYPVPVSHAAAPLPTPTVLPANTPAPAAAALPTNTPTPQPASTLAPTGPTSYTVQSGDTLQTIARRFGISVEALALFNQLGNWWLIYPGQVLTIPSANDPIPTRTPYPEGTAYIWPVESRAIIKGYQYGHAAIDIVVDTGTPVIAIADGVVEFAGWNNYGYGWLIVINHSDGVSTLYAHHDTLAVETGQEVKQGQTIGFSGNTGNSTMPHLHLEFRLNLGAVNPCSYLPDGC